MDVEEKRGEEVGDARWIEIAARRAPRLQGFRHQTT